MRTEALVTERSMLIDEMHHFWYTAPKPLPGALGGALYQIYRRNIAGRTNLGTRFQRVPLLPLPGPRAQRGGWGLAMLVTPILGVL